MRRQQTMQIIRVPSSPALQLRKRSNGCGSINAGVGFLLGGSRPGWVSVEVHFCESRSGGPERTVGRFPRRIELFKTAQRSRGTTFGVCRHTLTKSIALIWIQRHSLGAGHSCVRSRTQELDQMSRHPLLGTENRQFARPHPSRGEKQRFEGPDFRPFPPKSKC